MKKLVKTLERTTTALQAERLTAGAAERVALYRLETDIIANLRRVYYYTRRIARAAVPKDEFVEMSDRDD